MTSLSTIISNSGVDVVWGPSLSHLYPRLVQLGDPGQFFPVVDVWILVLPKGHLQLLQLFVGEGGAVASPGGGGVRPLRPAVGGHRGGLAQGALPQGVPHVCFEEGEPGVKLFSAWMRTPAPVSSFSLNATRPPQKRVQGTFPQRPRGEKKRGIYINFVAPTVVGQPESRRALAAEGGRVRKRYQKRRDFGGIIRTIPNKTTNLTNWWTGSTFAAPRGEKGGADRTASSAKTTQNSSFTITNPSLRKV